MSRRSSHDHALLLLSKAETDKLVLEKLSDDDEIADEAIGFHAQQAVEKLLKAVLASNEVEYPRVHDIDSSMGPGTVHRRLCWPALVIVDGEHACGELQELLSAASETDEHRLSVARSKSVLRPRGDGGGRRGHVQTEGPRPGSMDTAHRRDMTAT